MTDTDTPALVAPLRRALLTNEFMPSPGGVERLLYLRASEFEPAGVTVFAPRVPGCADFDAGRPYTTRRTAVPGAAIPGWRDLARSLAPALRLYREHRRTPFQLIECGQTFPTALVALALRRLTGTPYLVWVHGNDLLGPARYRLLRGAIRTALCRAEAVVTNSTYTAGLIAGFGVPEAHIRVIDPVVDLHTFQPQAPSPALRERYALGDGPVLLTVCRLVRRKGVDLVIEALARLVPAYPGLRYLVVGAGPERRNLEALARRHGVAERVIFAGSVPEKELPAHYHLASVFVMPSRYLGDEASVEGLGLVYLEAMASGLPVVAGRSGGVPDIVHDGENGILVAPDSVTDLARALDTLLRDGVYAGRLGDNGLAFVRRPREWRVLAVRVPRRNARNKNRG
ncbi:GDP-mannose-dependent alpha-(1-6)-phosphatidylinositol monomannoside mannosyltransferase [bacterium BMS3Bbin12]|nr:GDP-mannose-dependent alpha-(1-6)-phosphatidylinositol monomannoside mannosyltransferase [bacterium BMS3Abin12]GBE47499.1 GDP-mannose-dependent alpha-(1-6)-phosphatidylinositol monomannoside mannosyltransferase [bacterium BMS3Bbin12]GBE51162.1 GDP-mannose-dependent alpha-(1-6)-phosphatidylinositol monomannoside mannosyltransferase [bacterium BMS3Bbin13]